MSTLLHVLGYGLDVLLFAAGAVLLAAGLFGRLGAAVLPALATIPGVVFVALRYAGLALMLYAGGAIWLRGHDAALQATWTADQRAAAASDLAAAYKAGQDAVAAQHAAELAAVQASIPVHQEIARREALGPVPVPAPTLAALDELRRRAGASGGP